VRRGAAIGWLAAALSAGGCGFRAPLPAPGAWAMHTIDRSSAGADGVRLGDVNGDGLADIATAWEEGGRIRVYLHPGPRAVKEPWPAVTVGEVHAPEDAVFVDLDGDGAVDVVSSCEGRERKVFVHWAPRGREAYRDARAWKTQPLPASVGKMQWMFTAPMQVDGRHGVDLVAGGKQDGARVGWFAAPADARDLGRWRWHPVYDAGWIMSLEALDLDGDGDQDLLLSDRRGERAGVKWLENPGPGGPQTRAWTEHAIGATGREAMFLTVADLDGDGLEDVVAAVREKQLCFFRRENREGRRWEEHCIEVPASAGTAKSVAAGDIDGDGRMDLVFSCEHARGKAGVMWLSYRASPIERAWVAREISGAPGTKFDLVRLIDLDGDGDLDVLTCEEAENLGVIWYENPRR